MKSIIPALMLLLMSPAIFSGCNEDAKINHSKIDSKKENSNVNCDDFWDVCNPDNSIKINLLKNELARNKNLTEENTKLLNTIIKELQETRSMENIPLTFEYPLFPIHRLKKKQIGVLGYSVAKDENGQWEDFSKEDQLLKKDFGYQSIDSIGVLVSFPKVYNKLFPESKPSVYWYSIKKKGKATLTQFCYMGDDCLSYFNYTLGINADEESENIVFGSPFSLDLDHVTKPDLDRKFQSQFIKNCVDCPSNYKDQIIFAQLKGSNIYFTQADSWPINNKLKSPSRSMVLLTKEGQLITIWNSELDLTGCGCF
jgi:hypothetical protein